MTRERHLWAETIVIDDQLKWSSPNNLNKLAEMKVYGNHLSVKRQEREKKNYLVSKETVLKCL